MTEDTFDSLPAKQKLFVMYMVNDPQQRAPVAARNAGYSERTVDSQASRLLKNVKVAKAIELRTKDMRDRMRISADELLHKLTLLASFNINRFLSWSEEGVPYFDFNDATDDDWYCIEEITMDRVNKGGVEVEMVVDDDGNSKPVIKKVAIDRIKLKATSKIRALELAGRHIDVQAFKDKVEVEDTTDRAAQLRQARQRALEADNG